MNASPPLAATAPLDHSEVRLIIVGVLVAMFLAALDQTIVATALATIGRDLGNFDLLPWVVTAYLVTSTAVTPLYGKFSDIHGRRPTLLVGICVFVIGSAACALAPNMLALILGRALQGLGGGGLISLAQTIIADVVSPRERGRYQVYIASVFISSSLAGPVLGGFFAQHLHWSLIFWINLPLGALAFVMTDRLLRRLPRHERKHAIDVLGAVLLVAATCVLMLGLNWGGTRYPWVSAPIAGLFAGSAVLWALFALRLGRAPEPLIPLSLFRNGVVRNGTLSACFGMGVFIGMSIYVPVYLETVRGLSAADSGLALVPLMVGTVVGATLSGRLMARVTHYRRLPTAGLCLAIVATLALTLEARTLPLPALEVLFTMFSIGLGSLLPVTTVAIQNAVSPNQLGTATAGMNFFRSLGGALVVAVFGAILLGGGAGAAMHEVIPVQGSAADIAGAFHLVFGTATVFLLFSLLFLFRMEELPLRGAAPKEGHAAAAGGH
jgi:EmrB/QacA subfamily drug resistance transporter